MSTVSASAFGGANGLLEVYVSRARDLPNLRKLDKQSPFVRLRISHMTETSDVAFRGGQTPKFDYYAKFDLTPDVKPALAVEIFDDRSPPKLIGQCAVDLTPALYKDPEDGHDDWFPLSFGSEEAGEIYLELTFHPLIPTSRLQRHRSDGISAFEESLASRPPPPLPAKLPSFQLEKRHDEVTHNNTYSHASNLSQTLLSEPERISFGQSVSSKRMSNLDVSVASNSTFASQATNETHESHATVATSGTTEPLFAKLKQLKEKWNSIKNPGKDQQDHDKKVDLEALQKVVGVEPEEFNQDERGFRRVTDVSTQASKLVTQPPLPRLPDQSSRRTSIESRALPTSRPNSCINEMSPKLPPLPRSPSSRPDLRTRTAPNSPVRRKPPPKW